MAEGDIQSLNTGVSVTDLNFSSPSSGGQNRVGTIVNSGSGRTMLTIYPFTKNSGSGRHYVLPLPKGMNDTFENTWENKDLGRFMGGISAGQGFWSSLYGGITTVNGNYITERMQPMEAVVNYDKINRRYEYNQHTQLMYKAPALRQFQFSWSLKPKNKKQAEDINAMVKDIRASSYPNSTGGDESGGRVFDYPCEFSMRVTSAGGRILLNTIGCACTSLQVSYDTEGNPYVHDDGEPVTTTITVSLQESKTLSRSTIESLYQ